jgi:sodium-dependent dicarboxylate transporter 2/3/5
MKTGEILPCKTLLCPGLAMLRSNKVSLRASMRRFGALDTLTELTTNGRATHQKIGLALGPAIALLMLVIGPPDDLALPAWRTAAMGSWMAIWWATEAVPIAVTALLPIVLFPLLGIAGIAAATAPFANKVIFLFLGGFVVALAMQRWNLHRRIALFILQRTGGSGRSLIGGFMLASGFLSMWVMNTSTTMMMLPIAISIIAVIHNSVGGLSDQAKLDFQYALLLGVAYASSIGGMSTLVGTAPNAMMAAFMSETYNLDIDFASWMLVGVPLSIVMGPLAWLALTRGVFKVDFTSSSESRAALQAMHDDLSPMSVAEKRVGIIFLALVLTWITRPLLILVPGLEALDDSGISMAGAIALFIVPSGDKSDAFLLRWHHIEKLPWGILLLFGGGLSLASAVSGTGLAKWLGSSLADLTMLPIAVLVLAVATLIIFLTELTSNTATTATFLPVVGAVAIEAGVDPIVLLVPVTLAASCAFMLPVATPPNAIVFGSGLLTIPKIARAGFALNLIGIVLVTIVALTIAPRFLHG